MKYTLSAKFNEKGFTFDILISNIVVTSVFTLYDYVKREYQPPSYLLSKYWHTAWQKIIYCKD